MMVALGVELSTDADVASIAVAGRDGGKWLADLVFYGSPDDVAAECSRLYLDLDNCGVWCDPLPCAGVLDDLRAGVWLHLLSAEDVAAASWQYATEVRARRVKLGKHPALREAMRAAVPRPLAARFAFERKRVVSDMSPLNAAAFALLGSRRNEGGEGDPGVYAIGTPGGEAAATARGRLSEQETADLVASVYRKTRAGIRREDGSHG